MNWEFDLEEWKEQQPCVVEFSTIDAAGNESRKVETFYWDCKAPETKVSVEPIYSKEQTNLQYLVRDHENSCGIRELTYYYKEEGRNSEKTIEKLDKRVAKPDEKGEFILTIPQDFKGYLYGRAKDNLENEEENFIQSPLLVESKEKHKDTSKLIFHLKDTIYKDQRGHRLYDEAQQVSFEIQDDFSGIKELSWWIETEHTSKQPMPCSVVFDKPQYHFTQNITVEEEGTSMVWVEFVYYAGHTTKKCIPISIDMTKPKVNVEFQGKAPLGNSKEKGKLFNENKVLVVEIEDANFNKQDKEKLNIKLVNKLEHSTKNFWYEGKNQEKWDLKVPVEGDGTYTFYVEVRDAANHITAIEPIVFTIDTTPLRMSMDLNQESLHSISYVDQDLSESAKKYLVFSSNYNKSPTIENKNQVLTLFVEDQNLDNSCLIFVGYRRDKKGRYQISAPILREVSQKGTKYVSKRELMKLRSPARIN